MNNISYEDISNYLDIFSVFNLSKNFGKKQNHLNEVMLKDIYEWIVINYDESRVIKLMNNIDINVFLLVNNNDGRGLTQISTC